MKNPSDISSYEIIAVNAPPNPVNTRPATIIGIMLGRNDLIIYEGPIMKVPIAYKINPNTTVPVNRCCF